MVVMFFFHMLLLEKEVSLIDAHIYAYERTFIYKLNKGYVACSAPDHILATFEAGKITNTYSNKGQGPTDLNFPFILGVWDKKIYVCSGYKNILVFDENLTLLEHKFGSIKTSQMKPGITILGQMISPESAIVTCGMSPRMVHWIQFGQEESKVLASKYKSDFSDPMFAYMQNQNIFLAERTRALNSYMIRVLPLHLDYKKPSDDQLIMQLSNDISQFKPVKMPVTEMQFTAFIARALKYSKGYLVEFQYSSDLNKMAIRAISYWDYFDSNGKFIKRKNVGEQRLIPVTNSDVYFIYDPDKEKLIQIDL